MADPVTRAARWKLLLDETDGIGHILATMKAAYVDALTSCEPDDTDAMRRLVIAHRLTCEIEARIRRIIADGEVEAHSREMARKLEALPEAARRRL